MLPSFKTKEKPDVQLVLKKYVEVLNSLNKIEYNVNRIDTFAQGNVWNNKGYALIERNLKDTLFGFHFFAERFDLPKQFIYDGKSQITIDLANKSYTVDEGSRGYLGSPGGQMIVSEFFNQDSVYKTISLVEENDVYKLRYEFEDNIVKDVTSRFKIIELDKYSYVPKKVISSYTVMKSRAVHQHIISNIKIDNQVQTSVEEKGKHIKSFKLLENQEDKSHLQLLNRPFPKIELPELGNKKNLFTLKMGKVVLLDFWEVWCTPCQKSLPEVEQLKNKFPDGFHVIGIVSQDLEKAAVLVKNKGITFKNLIGNAEILKEYKVNGVPLYVLIDKKGIIQRQYQGFKKELIEKDIAMLLKD